MAISDPLHTLCSNLTQARRAEYNVIMKTMCHIGYHHNAFVALHWYGETLLITGRTHCFHDYIYITPIL